MWRRWRGSELGVDGQGKELGRLRVEVEEERRRFMKDAERRADWEGESDGEGYDGVGRERRRLVDDEGETGKGG